MCFSLRKTPYFQFSGVLDAACFQLRVCAFSGFSFLIMLSPPPLLLWTLSLRFCGQRVKVKVTAVNKIKTSGWLPSNEGHSCFLLKSASGNSLEFSFGS